MAYGTINVDTLTASTGVLATQNGMTGIAKAWANWDSSNGTIQGSYNISSITRTGTGQYTVNYTTAMPNSTYSVVGASLGYRTGVINTATVATTNCTIASTAYNTSSPFYYDQASGYVCIAVFSS